MTKKNAWVETVLNAAVQAPSSSAVHRQVRRAVAADIIAQEASDDQRIVASAMASLDAEIFAAGTASPTVQAIGMKLALLIHIRAAACIAGEASGEQADIMLLASALADCVILGDGPVDIQAALGDAPRRTTPAACAASPGKQPHQVRSGAAPAGCA